MTRSFAMSRRDWLRAAALGVGSTSLSGWGDLFAAEATTAPRRAKQVVMLWLQGGPATIDLWDLKVGAETGGPFREIETSAPGVRISEHLPKVARWMHQSAIVRSISSKEGDHDRATHYIRTGYTPQGAIKFPALGALVAKELGNQQGDLPSFVSIAPSRLTATIGGGFLGPHVAPLTIAEGASNQNGLDGPGVDALRVPNLARPAHVDEAAFSGRLALLERMERGVANKSSVEAGVEAANQRAIRMMRPEAAAAFRLDDENDATRDRYGRNLFGQGCLLARRLIERGVACVEVTLGGWDTHQNNFERVQGLSTTLDGGFASLMQDLHDRGLLDSTLIVCMGEFGRTPKINGNTGRDHWAPSWSAVLAGGGVKGGQAIGATSSDGTEVTDRKVSVPDVIATACTLVGLDPKKQNLSNVSRPIRLADPDAKAIQELV